MFHRRGEDFDSWHRTEQGAGRKMHDEAPSGRDLGRDGTDHPGIHEDPGEWDGLRSEEHTSELQSLRHLVCRLLLEIKNSVLIKATSTMTSKSLRLLI